VLTFLSCTVFNLFDVPLFDARVNIIGWLVLAAIWGTGQTKVADEEEMFPTRQ
jgi:hypothetical protein